MSAAGTVAVSCELLTKVVANAAPFQSTVAPEANPVPFTVNVNDGPPGVTLVGTSGLLIRGTAFCHNAAALANTTRTIREERRRGMAHSR
jgi:hypothetical protein